MHHNIYRYISGLQSAPLSLGRLETVCCINFCAKCLNRIVVKKKMLFNDLYGQETNWFTAALYGVGKTLQTTKFTNSEKIQR